MFEVKAKDRLDPGWWPKMCTQIVVLHVENWVVNLSGGLIGQDDRGIGPCGQGWINCEAKVLCHDV